MFLVYMTHWPLESIEQLSDDEILNWHAHAVNLHNKLNGAT